MNFRCYSEHDNTLKNVWRHYCDISPHPDDVTDQLILFKARGGEFNLAYLQKTKMNVTCNELQLSNYFQLIYWSHGLASKVLINSISCELECFCEHTILILKFFYAMIRSHGPSRRRCLTYTLRFSICVVL